MAHTDSEKTSLLGSSVLGKRETYGKIKRTTCAPWHPPYIELAALIYHVTYSCTLPVIDQFVRSTIEGNVNTKVDKYLNWLYLSSDISPFEVDEETGEVHQCPSNANMSDFLAKRIDAKVQSSSSLYLMYIDICNTVPAVFTTMLICTLGDTMGRKFGITLTSAGSAIKTLSYVITIQCQTSPALLLVGSLVDGFSGSHLCFLGCAYAYIADTSTIRDRSIRFMILATLSTVGTAITNLAVGYLIKSSGYLLVFSIFTVLHFINTFYIIICIPNAKPQPVDSNQYPETKVPIIQYRRRRSSVQRMKEGALDVSVKLYGAVRIFSAKSEIKGQRLKLGLLLSAFVIQASVLLGKGSVDTLFLFGFPICFDSVAYGYYTFFGNLFHGALGLLGVWVLTRYLRDITLEIIGCISFVISRVMLAYAQSPLHAYITLLVSFGVNMTLTLVRSMMSKLIVPEKQGALMAVVFSLETFCDVTSGILMNSIYAATVAWFPGFTFILMAAIYSMNIVLLIIYFFVERSMPSSVYAIRSSEVGRTSSDTTLYRDEKDSKSTS